MGRWVFRLTVYLSVLLVFAWGAPNWPMVYALVVALVFAVVLLTVIEVVKAGAKKS